MNDGAQTRDLCRDSYSHGRNLLILGASVAPKSILNHPKTHFGTVVRTVKFSAGNGLQPVQNFSQQRQSWAGAPARFPALRNHYQHSTTRRRPIAGRRAGVRAWWSQMMRHFTLQMATKMVIRTRGRGKRS